ncbi:MAG TPA: hypothetical protein VG605_04560, partial [Puia sp.]|nr:hypothetical protein [Puia sp.]
GAAMLGWYATETFSLEQATALVSVVATYDPNPALAGVYQRNFRIFSELYGRLKDLMQESFTDL